jgi:hypothetical protein
MDTPQLTRAKHILQLAEAAQQHKFAKGVALGVGGTLGVAAAGAMGAHKRYIGTYLPTEGEKQVVGAAVRGAQAIAPHVTSLVGTVKPYVDKMNDLQGHIETLKNHFNR